MEPRADIPTPIQSRLNTLLEHALLLDLEVSHQGHVLKTGAVLGSRALTHSGSFSLPDAAHALSQMAANAACVLGHNLAAHDLPVLREQNPRHPLLRLPVIDTLVLSPISFPENPYHRLVKDYKIVSESVNDPVADARQAAILFADEFRSLHGLRQTEPRLFELLHFLLAAPESPEDRLAQGMDLVFKTLDGILPAPGQALELCRTLVGQWACANAPVEASSIRTSSQRLTLAYTLTWLRVAGSNSILPPWVRLRHPDVATWIKRLRQTPCSALTTSISVTQEPWAPITPPMRPWRDWSLETA